MKTSLSLVAGLLLSTIAIARPLPVNQDIITLDEDTKVVEISVRTKLPQNCPGQMDLVIEPVTEPQAHHSYMISVDEKAQNLVNLLRGPLTPECKEDLRRSEALLRNVPVCLSFGHPWGTVYLRVDRLAQTEGSVTVHLSDDLVIHKVEQLK